MLLGTSGLMLAALAALAVTVIRDPVAGDQVPAVRKVASLAILSQLAHFTEEYLYDFHLRFPAILGLIAWPRQAFAAFNLFWLVIWLVALAALVRLPRASAFPLWFLAIASIANGLVHPVLSLTVRDYFPGLWTSPLVAVLGVLLISTLSTATRPGSTTAAPRS